MREMLLSYLPTMDEFIKNVVLTLFSAVVLAAAGYVALRLWKHILAGAKAGKRWGYSEIRKRFRSDSYFVARQTSEVVSGGLMLGVLITVLVLFSIPEMPDREGLILPLALLTMGMGAIFIFETTCNAKATTMRARSEKRRKIPRRKWQGKT